MALILPSSSQSNSTNPADPSHLIGRLLCINPEKGISRFQCGGFYIGGRVQYSRVGEDAQLVPIQNALQNGTLLDITDQFHTLGKEGKVVLAGGSELDQKVEDTNKKFYMARDGDSYKVFFTDNPEEQAEIEKNALSGSKLVLPEGFGDEEKYLIKLTPIETTEYELSDNPVN